MELSLARKCAQLNYLNTFERWNDVEDKNYLVRRMCLPPSNKPFDSPNIAYCLIED